MLGKSSQLVLTLCISLGIVFVHSIPGLDVLRHGQKARDMPAHACTIKDIKPRSKAKQASGLGGSVGRWCAW